MELISSQLAVWTKLNGKFEIRRSARNAEVGNLFYRRALFYWEGKGFHGYGMIHPGELQPLEFKMHGDYLSKTLLAGLGDWGSACIGNKRE